MAKGEIDFKVEVVEPEVEKQRRQLWIDVYIHCLHKEGYYAINSADYALDKFDQRFNQPKQSHE